jgi:hypothetical protein
MARNAHADSRDGATEPKFYLPAGVTPSFVTRRIESIRATRFHRRIRY